MTAKQELLEIVECLSEEAAERVLPIAKREASAESSDEKAERLLGLLERWRDEGADVSDEEAQAYDDLIAQPGAGAIQTRKRMVRIVCLDAGPLGMAAHPRPSAEFNAWVAQLIRSGVHIYVPEIADFEVRRELIRANRSRSVEKLDEVIANATYEPITTAIMRRAAELWAETRNRGRPLADPHALDADVILAATAEAIEARGHDVTIATTNLGHLASVAKAAIWSDIRR